MPQRTRLERRRAPELKAAGWWDGESPPRGRQADKKMGVKKMNSGCLFFATHLFASPNSSVIQELGTSQRPHMMGGSKFQVTSSRFPVQSSGALTTRRGAAGDSVRGGSAARGLFLPGGR